MNNDIECDVDSKEEMQTFKQSIETITLDDLLSDKETYEFLETDIVEKCEQLERSFEDNDEWAVDHVNKYHEGSFSTWGDFDLSTSCLKEYSMSKDNWIDEGIYAVIDALNGEKMYRSMLLNQKQVQEIIHGTRNVGIFWSWNEDKAQVYAREKCKIDMDECNEYVLHGYIDKPNKESVDVNGTIATNVFYMSEETEVRMNPDQCVYVEKICKFDSDECYDVNKELLA